MSRPRRSAVPSIVVPCFPLAGVRILVTDVALEVVVGFSVAIVRIVTHTDLDSSS